MEITIQPVKGRMPTDEQGLMLTNSKTIAFNEFWARRLHDGDVAIVKATKERGKML